MDKKIIIGIVAEQAAGKGTVADYLKNKYGASTFRFSTMLRDVLNRLYVEINRENMQLLSTILRQNFGEDLMAKVISRDVTSDSNKIIVVEGVRRFADIEYLRKIDGFFLTKIVADPKIRYERLKKRAENEGDTTKTYEEFLADHTKEADAEVPLVMEQATITINNDGSLDELFAQIDKIIAEDN